MAKGWHSQFKRAPKHERTDREGNVFDSKSELHRWETLRLRVLAGEIRKLRRQVEYPLVVNGKRIGKYTMDFVYEQRVNTMSDSFSPQFMWVEIVEEHKGFFDQFSRFRIALFEAIYDRQVLLTGEVKKPKKARKKDG